jgi:signal transduction histidine kinase
MQTPSTEVVYFITIISTLLILFFGSIIIRYIFLYQRRRFRHQQEILEMRETYNHTLMESKLQIQEDTLKHIAEELHANASHQASLINIHLSEMLEKGSPEMKESIYEIKLIAKQLMGDLKALSVGLNSNYIMKIGFTKALENELNRMAKTKKIITHFNKTGNEYRLRTDHDTILFRMCQEILNNVMKYSEAESVTVSLSYLPNLFQLEISDDGIGFNIEDALNNSGEKQSTGLMNMQNRAKLIDAKLEMNSEKDKGTRFIISIPIQQTQT